MPATTFTWYPDADSQHTCTPSVTVVKFGDGYELRQSSGVNNTPDKWSLQFQRTRTEATDILNFLRARAAVEAFNWTNPLNEAGVYVCRSWRATSKSGGILVSCDFERVYEV